MVNSPKSPSTYALEICVETYRSAQLAWEGGAQRIEVCASLEVGGVTPSFGLVKKIKEELPIETHVLIRPRAGDFIYTSVEWDIIRYDIAQFKTLGVDGVVIGGLTPRNQLDLEPLLETMDEAKGLQVTFHRAFDLVENPLLALEQLKKNGFHRLLTSGQSKDVYQGKDCIKALVIQAEKEIEIMPGGGVTLEGAASLLRTTGATSIHTTARWGQNPTVKLPLGMGATPIETSIKNVRSLADILKSLSLSS
jgi:copper homeostasis protein